MHDIILLGGWVIDGTGKAAYKADVAVRDGRISKIGSLEKDYARVYLDCANLIVSPGFIDSHAHSDTSFLKDSSCASKLYQGITTEITGQCGSSPFPSLKEKLDKNNPWHFESFSDFVSAFKKSDCSMATNQAILVGHGSLRAGVIGYENREATKDELEKMKALLRRDLAEGAWGMSLGLEYSPGFFAGKNELSALSSIVREFGGLVPCHMRNEGLEIGAAIRELVSIGKETGAHVHISHLKLDHFRMHGRAEEVWKQIEGARNDGVNITCDMYPFLASCTDLTIRCPKWSQEGGNKKLIERLKGDERQKVVEGIRAHYLNAERAETCLFADDGGHFPEIVGKTLRYVAEVILKIPDYAEAAAEVLIRTDAEAGCIFFVMNESDMLTFLQKDVSIGSDGWALSGDANIVKTKPHPRSYGAITEFLRLAREKNLCSIEEAVRRVTKKPAQMIGFTDRGELKEGFAADVCVFDPNEIAPTGTYLEPVRLSKGVKHVIVNGEIALKDGVQTSVRAGKFLKKR
ncbi:MAG: D-aminoacylase [Clostridia bacterium]|nr:D-aminoacylase [Clostridia bacterium]